MKFIMALVFYALSIGGGHYACWYSLFWMRKRVFPNNPKEWDRPSKVLGFFIGATERFMATTLVIFAPAYLAPFVGGWVALKYAANWQRQNERFRREKSLLAMIGTTMSFAIAIIAGCFINPEALNYFRMTAHGH